jgi:hypothetical protein
METTLLRAGWNGHPVSLGNAFELRKPKGLREVDAASFRRLGLLLAMLAIGCGGGATSPTPNGVPATVTVTGNWFGTASDSLRQAHLSLTLKQNGGDVTGSVTGETVTSLPLYTSGTLTGTVSGSTFRFTIRIPLGSVTNSPTCSVALNGSTTDLTATGLTANGMSGTYTGTDSCFGDLIGGLFTFSKQ